MPPSAGWRVKLGRPFEMTDATREELGIPWRREDQRLGDAGIYTDLGEDSNIAAGRCCDEDELLLEIVTENREGLIDYLVTAANAHHELVEALKRTLNYIENTESE